MDKEKIKKEQQQIIGIIPVMDMKAFATLLLADLASKSPIVYFDDRNTKTAVLSTEYKKIIEDIMYQENGWGIKFAELINTYSYYEFQSDWEKKFGKTIEKVLKELNKEFIYDFENDRIMINFSQEEIENIKSNFDEEVLNNMDHFTNLISSTNLSRSFQLEMIEMNRSINREIWEHEQININIFKRIGIMKPEKHLGKFKSNESKY